MKISLYSRCRAPDPIFWQKPGSEPLICREEAEEELRLREVVEVLRSREEDDTTEENAEEMRERMRIMEEEQVIFNIFPIWNIVG